MAINVEKEPDDWAIATWRLLTSPALTATRSMSKVAIKIITACTIGPTSNAKNAARPRFGELYRRSARRFELRLV